MTRRSSPERLLRRSRAVGWATAAGASLATVGLIVGIEHSSVAATATTSTTSTTTGTSKSSGTNTSQRPTTKAATASTSSSSTVQAPTVQQQPVAGSHGS